MSAKYIIRLDDASEYMDHNKWYPFFQLFERYNIKPIIAVIPYNKDPKMVIKNPDDNFWEKVKLWQTKEYRIGLHGYEHMYKNQNSGIIGINRYSEFAGVPLETQTVMLSRANKKFEDEGIKADIFVAPAHSFDRNTLKALKSATNIKYISDGFFYNPILKDDLKWIPQQLWEPKNRPKGVWTICYHPETSDKAIIDSLGSFLEKNNKYVVDPFSLNFEIPKFEDILFSLRMKYYMKLRSSFYSVVKIKR